jgi:hypothetical protein
MTDFNSFLKMQGYEEGGNFDFKKFQEMYGKFNLLPENQRNEILKSMQSSQAEKYNQLENNLSFKCFQESYNNLYKDVPQEKQTELLMKSIQSEDGIKEYFGNIIKNMQTYDSENTRNLVKQTVEEYIKNHKI